MSTTLPKLERNHLFIRHFSLERAEFFCILGGYNSGWAKLPDEIPAVPISLGEHGALGRRHRLELSMVVPEFMLYRIILIKRMIGRRSENEHQSL